MLISPSHHLLCLSAITDWPLLSSTFKRRTKLTGWYKNINVDSQIEDGTKRRMNVGIKHACNAILPHDQLKQVSVDQEVASNVIDDQITSIKSMLNSMEDGEITVSPYDTAWVALIKNVNGNNNAPLFPSCLQWIAKHQLEDGSWGDGSFFGAHDRLINTLACVIVLKSWNVYPEKLERGISYLKENMHKLRDDQEETLLVGFEVAFPSLLKMAQKLDIQVVEDSTVLEQTFANRNLKLNSITNELLHTVPTTLLHSLEGIMMGLDWNKLLKLQIKDGSFFHSPSSTAFAFMQTKDESCLSYIEKLVQKFDGGAPCVYPVEIFEKIWVVDRLQRLGISRNFQTEVKECLNYINRYWTDKGIGMGKFCTIPDIDDTCMTFRPLRLHGYHVSPDALRHFEKGEEFVCYTGQLKQGVSDTFNLLRASQLMFPGETILQRAKNFSFKFLKEKQASNRLIDRWLITKDLPGEVGYALDVPWYASIPHVETRLYIDQYGGDDDVWISKAFYRMSFISNSKYLDLAKLQFKQCQAQHQLEWKTIQKWYTDSNFGDLGISREELLLTYFLAAAIIFEPERSNERIAWTKTAVLIKIIDSYFNNQTTCINDWMTFIHKLNYSTTKDRSTNKSTELKNTSEWLVDSLVKTIKQLSVVGDGRDIHQQLYRAWGKWIKTLHEEGHGYLGEWSFYFRQYIVLLEHVIPNELLHTIPTTLLHSLEGIMIGLDWNKLLKLQNKDGSFFHSPSSTAFAFMQTKDESCLSYIEKLVRKFDGGAPCVYPVEIFEKIWVVDRLQRLGISRNFQTEVKECLNYINRYWTDKGIGMGKFCTIPDIDDTCMAFRLLRLHGYHVSPDALRHFEKGEEYVCYVGQLKQGVSDTFDLLRASQLMFPGETILERAKNFSFKFIKEKQASNRLIDRWLITKDLPGEVGYALDVPWYASLPHVETRFYIDQYGGDDDVWIGKSFYRMSFISNSKYLDLAKLQFKQCQTQHQLEWKTIQKWYTDSNFGDLGISREELLLAYFLAAASIFEPERSNERIAWTKTAVLIKIIDSYFNNQTTCINDRMTFIHKLNYSTTKDRSTNKSTELENTSEWLVDSLVKTIKQLSVVGDGRDIHQQSYRAWGKWIKTLHEEGHGYLGEAELLLQTIYSSTGTSSNLEEPLTSPDLYLIQVTNKVCNKLRHIQDQKNEKYADGIYTNGSEETMTDPQIEDGMQELVQLVYQNPPDNEDDAYIKQICLAIAKTFYYTAYCDTKTIDSHIVKILFDRVD